MKNGRFVVVAALLGGLFLTLGPRLSVPEKWSSDLSGYWQGLFSKKASLEGTRLLAVHEKVSVPVSEVIAIRGAADFVAANKMTGFLDVDKDDEWATALIADVKKTYKIDPPFLTAVKIEQSEIKRIVKVVPWKNGLEDLLK